MIESGLPFSRNQAQDEVERRMLKPETCLRLAQAFYARIEHDPLLRPIFPASFHCAIPALGRFIEQVCGGRCEYSRTRYLLSLQEAHHSFQIGEPEREAWVRQMALGLADIGADAPTQKSLTQFFDEASWAFVKPPSAGHAGDFNPLFGDDRAMVIVERWRIQMALDDVVRKIRQGEGGTVDALVNGPVLRVLAKDDSAAFVGVMSLLIKSGDPAMIECVERQLDEHPHLVRSTHYYGRTLLHEACGAGNRILVDGLLLHGSDPNAETDTGSTPLHAAANGSGTHEIVQALVEAGARVDIQAGVKRCTPLHDAARRGNADVAGALVDAGADVEMRDSLGETPLRRAVNCGKVAVAELLIARGADVHSVGSRGMSPATAARGNAMRRLFGLV